MSAWWIFTAIVCIVTFMLFVAVIFLMVYAMTGDARLDAYREERRNIENE